MTQGCYSTGFAASYISRLTRTLSALDALAFDRAINLVRCAWENGQQIIVFGNGGSALMAQHYVTDWSKGVYLATGKPLRGICLSENMGIMTAYANDLSFQDVFLAQLKPVMSRGDLVVGISGSGNSENVLRAIRYANENGGVTLGICGYDGGRLRCCASYAICADVDDMQLSEDVHLTFGHMTMQSLCGVAR
jgi:D-sedoheptulose 7-phosphate isomerase